MTTAQTTERHGTWRRILGWGLLLWVLSAFVTAITANLFKTFVVGGVLAASVAERYLLRPSPWMFFGVGLLEEAAKLAALAYCTRHLSVRSAQDGAILGAVLFSTAVRTGFRMTGRLVGAYLGVSVLHGLWDSMDSIAVGRGNTGYSTRATSPSRRGTRCRSSRS